MKLKILVLIALAAACCPDPKPCPECPPKPVCVDTILYPVPVYDTVPYYVPVFDTLWETIRDTVTFLRWVDTLVYRDTITERSGLVFFNEPGWTKIYGSLEGVEITINWPLDELTVVMQGDTALTLYWPKDTLRVNVQNGKIFQQ